MFINYNKVSALAFLRRCRRRRLVPMLVFSGVVKLLVVGQKSIKAFSGAALWQWPENWLPMLSPRMLKATVTTLGAAAG